MIINKNLSEDTVVSRDEFIYKYIASRDGTVSVYASRRIANIYNYQISKMAEPIKI